MTTMNGIQQQAIRTAYGFPEDTHFMLLRDAIDNMVYKITTPTRAYVARISKSDKTEGLSFEVELLNHLQQIMPVPQPVRTAEGREFVIADSQFVTLFTWLPGASLEVDLDHKPSLSLVRQSGSLLGTIHAASARFTPAHSSAQSSDTEIRQALQRSDNITADFEGGGQFIKELDEYTAWEQSTQHKSGILHHDFIPSNLLVEKDVVVGVLDFDWSCIGPFGKDVGLALALWSLPDGATEHWDDVFTAFLEGYNQTAPSLFMCDEYLGRWICYAMLSETAVGINDLNDKNEYTPGQPITAIKQFRRYKKFLWYKNFK